MRVAAMMKVRRLSVVEMALEIVDWRLQDYLLASKSVPDPATLPSPGGPQTGVLEGLEELG